MDAVYLHLALNHTPVVGVLLCACFLAAGWLMKSREVQAVANFALIGIALVTIAVYLSGDRAEHVVEELPGVSESILEEHEDMGFNAMVLVEVLGVLALANLVVYRVKPGISRPFASIVLAFALLTSAVLIWTANLGGQIRHSEIRAVSAPLGDG